MREGCGRCARLRPLRRLVLAWLTLPLRLASTGLLDKLCAFDGLSHLEVCYGRIVKFLARTVCELLFGSRARGSGERGD